MDLEEHSLHDYIIGLLQGPEFARLLHKRFFIGTIVAVAPGPNNTGKLCSVSRPGESGSDGNQYLTVDPAYYPQVGDVVECCWRDSSVAIILGPVSQSTVRGAPVKLMETIFASGPVGQVTFLNIDQAFRHLEVVIVAKSNTAVLADDLGCWVNNARDLNYGSQNIDSAGSSLSAGSSISDNRWPYFMSVPGSNATAIGGGRALFPNYTSTVTQKGFISHSSTMDYGTPNMRIRSGGKLGAGPITRLDFACGGTMQIGTFTLYGLP